MPWLPAKDTIYDHYKIKRLGRAIPDDYVATGFDIALSKLFQLWLWSLRHAPDGDLSKLEYDDIEEAARWSGERGKFVELCLEYGFIDKLPNGNHIIHDWLEHGGSYAESKRKQRNRAKQRSAARLAEAAETTVSRECPGTVPGQSRACPGNVPHKEEKRIEENIYIPPPGSPKWPKAKNANQAEGGLAPAVSAPDSTLPEHVPDEQVGGELGGEVPDDECGPECDTDPDAPPLALAPPVQLFPQTGQTIAGRIDEVYQHYRTYHPRYTEVLTRKRKEYRLVRARLKDHTVAELKEAIDWYERDPYHCGENAQQTKYLSLELMMRDEKHVMAGLEGRPAARGRGHEKL